MIVSSMFIGCKILNENKLVLILNDKIFLTLYNFIFSDEDIILIDKNEFNNKEFYNIFKNY